MSKPSASDDATRAVRNVAQPQVPPVVRAPRLRVGPSGSTTIGLSLADDQDVDASAASTVVASVVGDPTTPAVVEPETSQETPAIVRPADLVPTHKVLLILCSRNGTARQAIGRFSKQMNVPMRVIESNPDEPHSIADQLFAHRDAKFAIIYWGEPAGREPPGFAHPERYLGFVLGFALGRLGRGRVFILGSADTAPLPGFGRVMVTPLDPTGDWQSQLARRMKVAGINLDMNRLA